MALSINAGPKKRSVENASESEDNISVPQSVFHSIELTTEVRKKVRIQIARNPEEELETVRRGLGSLSLNDKPPTPRPTHNSRLEDLD